MNLLKSMFRRAEPVELVLYSRPECGLCEEMKAVIGRASVRQKFSLREVNIESDPQLEAAHGLSIPVLEIAGRVAFKGRLTQREFERKFERLTGDAQA